MGMRLATLPVALLWAAAARGAVPVDVDNYVRAESDEYMRPFAEAVGVDAFQHIRVPTPVGEQGVVRMNRDTLYSMGVMDLAKPVTITLPEAGRRYLSMQVLSQDHYTKGFVTRPGAYTFTQPEIGTRYAVAIVRILVDASDPVDVQNANALQDRIAVRTEPGGTFEVPEWDRTSLARVRETLLRLADGMHDSTRMFGDADEVDPIHHLLGTAMGWGGLPASAALYLEFRPARNDGETPYALRVKDVPVDGFWSVSVYNRDGFFEWNERSAYVINDRNAVADPDGTVVVHFGGCGDARVNCLAIVPGWSYVVRLYQPRRELRDGSWGFPEAQPIP